MSTNIFSFIKERIAIFDVASEYVTLKKAGGYYKGNCPFHHEKTASFTISPDKNIFYCFGCHLSGDVISFIARIENCSQKDAAQFLADKYHLTIPIEFSFDVTEKATEEKNHYFFVCKSVALWCHEQLLKNDFAQSYFFQRKFSFEMLDYFTVGYFPSGNSGINDLLYAMKRQSIMLQDLLDTHILIQGRTSLYSPFEDRFIFPIKDTLGRFCGFGGRIFKEHDTRSKYYNSHENDYFTKGSLLFNIDKAKQSIQKSGKIFLVEGYTDCMAMTQMGMTNTVATLGTACTQDHLKQLARYADHIIVIYDNDNAGRSAIIRLTEMCWHVNLELKIVILPSGHDPASLFAKEGTLQEHIEKAIDIFHFFLNTLGNDFITKPLHKKTNAVRSFLSFIAPIQDPLKKDILLQRATIVFDIPFESLKQELNRLTHQITKKTSQPEIILKKEDESISLLEKQIFCAIMNNMQLFSGENRLQLIKYLPSPLRDILAKLKIIKEISETVTFNYFFDTLNEQEKHYISKLLLKENSTIDSTDFDLLLKQFQKKQWKVIVRDIKNQIMQAKQEGNTHKADILLQDLVTLQSTLL